MSSIALAPNAPPPPLRGDPRVPTVPRAFQCRCGQPVFFPNSTCVVCKTPLGYVPEKGLLLPVEPAEVVDTWRAVGPAAEGDETLGAQRFRRCENFDNAVGCNWLVPAPASDAAPDAGAPPAVDVDGQALVLDAPPQPAEPGQRLCRACRLNRTIPDLSLDENCRWWAEIERAKRRLVSSLIALKLPVASRVSEDPQHGLAFDLLRAPPGGPGVITGHAGGIITLDIEEADDIQREGRKAALHEPYRTLLGHLRHEVGHYYWDRLIAGTAWHEPFRAIFGDEREDYAAALRRHYEIGPPPDWALSRVSAYASAHPWEDWAETWAHYLHMLDTLDTASSFGLDAAAVELNYVPFTEAALSESPAPPDAMQGSETAQARQDGFLGFVNAWMELTGVLNELSRSMGQPDFYPFVLSMSAVRKLHLVHRVLNEPEGPSGPTDETSGELAATTLPAA